MLRTRKELDAQLPDSARAWLDEALAEARERTGEDAADPYAVPAWELRFASVGRHCGQDHADSVRTLLLVEARADTPTLTRLYQQGTAAERRALLLALPHLVEGPAALPLTEDALRTNDTRLVAAAVGPYAAAHLGPHAWRHAVLKCLFTGVPLDAVADLPTRAAGDSELARMLADYAAERTAAGRDVPHDLNRVLTLTGELSEES
ncbi:EboA domain-containing protein [Streptomyces lunaelactis]|uniref:EboA domain-containing protein n=1 Tax=Streptomyces lunaelactis TaxID=1535768 RepID=UPI0015848428|nr:EboA domain-containing protein [Streptomyces lunaelactis]NUK55488.1 EboA domain-containing protein [Streptomyces lunaelactis]NUK69162.1 EboA domain-containing protein [Streptomyces lunaelactis]